MVMRGKQVFVRRRGVIAFPSAAMAADDSLPDFLVQSIRRFTQRPTLEPSERPNEKARQNDLKSLSHSRHGMKRSLNDRTRARRRVATRLSPSLSVCLDDVISRRELSVSRRCSSRTVALCGSLRRRGDRKRGVSVPLREIMHWLAP